ncbi:MAG: ribonucleotide reductase subunit alpha [Gammaproteobacteria bacterium]|nr:ribonucleotide reductase subunit alpha [Gammaproteobacteria bacterium]
MHIHTYSDLISISKVQPEPQRLLFVLAKAELPEEPTEEQKARFTNKEGGYLEPVLCVDKLPSEVESFDSFVEESERTGVDWDVVFIAAMSGYAGEPPQPEQAEQPLQMMVEQIKAGMVVNFVTLDRQGQAIQLA